MDVSRVTQAAFASQISYATGLQSGMSGTALQARLETELRAKGVSLSQQIELAEHYRVVHQNDDSETGFSGVLLEDLSNPGSYTLSLRGSDSPGLNPDWLDANASNAIMGAATNQIVDLVNFYLRLTHSGPVNQCRYSRTVDGACTNRNRTDISAVGCE